MIIMEARGHPKPAQDPGAHELLQPDWFLARSGDLARGRVPQKGSSQDW